MLDYEYELYYLDTKQIINRPVEHPLSNWFDQAKNKGHFKPKKNKVTYTQWDFTPIYDDVTKLSFWFGVAKKEGCFKPDIN